MAANDDRHLDEKGRVTIPQRIRERLNLEPGERVRIEIEDGAVVLRPQVSRSAFAASMRGCISTESKREDAPSMTPEEMKADWTSDLPENS